MATTVELKLSGGFCTGCNTRSDGVYRITSGKDDKLSHALCPTCMDEAIEAMTDMRDRVQKFFAPVNEEEDGG